MPSKIVYCLPGELPLLWLDLYSEASIVHMRYVVYSQLFGKSQERLDLLNELAGGAFWLIQESLWLNIQLSLSKIGDPAATGTRKNLTLRRFQLALKDAGEAALAEELEPYLISFEESCKRVREHRNKLLAHSDLDAKLEAQAAPKVASPLDVTRQEVVDALTHLSAVLNYIEIHYTGSSTAFNYPYILKDGDSLISSLARARDYLRLLRARKISIEDLRSASSNL